MLTAEWVRKRRTRVMAARVAEKLLFGEKLKPREELFVETHNLHRPVQRGTRLDQDEMAAALAAKGTNDNLSSTDNQDEAGWRKLLGDT